MAARILILLHETDPYPDGPSYFVHGLRDAWLEQGLDVLVAKGPEGLEPADLVIPHIDLTVTPPEYRQVLASLPNVVNRGVFDISKRRVSTNLLGPDDDHAGPVIVKTDLNFGGGPERALEERLGTRSIWGRARNALAAPRRVVRKRGYRIFDALDQVPRRVLSDPALVVEKFLPEQEGETYFLRWYIFLGDRFRSMRVGTSTPLVKLQNLSRIEFGLELPPEVLAFRERWGLDFGKIDFVMHDGKPVILDVSLTPSDVPPPERLDECRPYGPGVLPLLARARGVHAPFVHTDVDAG